MDQTPNTHSRDSLPAVVTDQTKQQSSSSMQPPKRPRQNRALMLAIVIGIIGLVGGFAAAQFYNSSQDGGSDDLASRLTSGEDGNKIVTEEEENISNVVSKVSPSVVSIVTESTSTSRFYGPTTEQGAGTGIIVSKDGHVMTNKHVIDGVSSVGVVLSDGTRYNDVNVLGTDPLNDIAFLKIDDNKEFAAAELGDSTSIRVGQKVIAIGNSLGQYQNTVTSGIISGTGRPVSAQAGNSVETLTDLIQTDAAINPGNSGGPLLNLQGQVIGVNTAIAADAQGIGFAIPIGATKGLLKSVLAGKGVERAYLGINYIPITADVAEHYDLSVKSGAYVFSGTDRAAVVTGSPAAKAGIKSEDVITKVGDIEVGDRGSVGSLVAEYAPGDTVQLTVLRDGKTMTMNVTLAAYER